MPIDVTEPASVATASGRIFLFSVDLEDIRTMFAGGERYRERVPEMTHRYLEFLRERRAKTTFFTVGRTAAAYPALIREIVAEGHELACHTHEHFPLDQYTRETFRDDLRRNIDALGAAGGTDIRGFRAPTFSLTSDRGWAYEVMAECGIAYSSSVLPARSPLYGWEDFGREPKRMGAIIEIPMTLRSAAPLRVPFGGGVYFRVLPWFVISREFRRCGAADRPVLGYFHPCDIDAEQERFMHPYLNGNRFYNFLMYFNRDGTLPRLQRLLESGWGMMRYGDYVRSHLSHL